ncbi:MAG TPA: c-type cytochrome [Pyrinomonadaceae bacterium]|nr:c-type cytochrome [Acidobacteriota bacterium]HQZ96950.1 c-type cytochrome [Pyrinomonadaceae bacterium]
MKLLFITAAALLFTACSTPSPANRVVPPAVERQTYKSVGIVRSIDIDTDRVTVDHEEIPGYMAAMEMNEMVADHELLGSIKVGDKVEFEIERRGSTVIYTSFRKIGTVAVVNGSEIYKTNCAECHGGSGEGTKKGIPLTSGHALDHSEEGHIKQVTNGEGNKMPAFRDKLTAEQIKEVVRFVREDIQKGLKRNEGHKH